MIYRLATIDDENESTGFEFFSSWAAAWKHRAWLCSEDGGEHDLGSLAIDRVEIPTIKKSVMALLRKWGGHPDNG